MHRRYPASGGTYVYGGKRLGHLWGSLGSLAGWGFVIGKQFPAAYATRRRGTCALHWGPQHPARLLLPVVPTT